MDFVHPTLLLDKERCLSNIHKMKARADKNNLSFRPHFKTHQSKQVGRWIKEAGVDGITVSSLKMAEYFAEEGWNDITIAFPVNIRAMDALNVLTEKVDLTLLVDNKEAAYALNKGLAHHTNILIEVDAGSRRTGIEIEDHNSISELVSTMSGFKRLSWKGFYSHFGHTYRCRGEEEVRKVFSTSMEKVNSMISKKSYDNAEVHIGDTPGCSLTTSFEGITTVTPGNFVFFDVMQHQIGSCSMEEIAVAMVCPVVSKNKSRNEICVHGGAVHFSKDSIMIDGIQCFGIMTNIEGNMIGKADYSGKLIAVSQEHGILKVRNEVFQQINIGDTVGILPIHSCLTAECMRSYRSSEGMLVDHM